VPSTVYRLFADCCLAYAPDFIAGEFDHLDLAITLSNRRAFQMAHDVSSEFFGADSRDKSRKTVASRARTLNAVIEETELKYALRCDAVLQLLEGLRNKSWLVMQSDFTAAWARAKDPTPIDVNEVRDFFEMVMADKPHRRMRCGS
jgi:hypothetical protein